MKLICIGDSITYGYPYGSDSSWVKMLQKQTGLPIINCGVNGDTLPGMKRRFSSDVVNNGAAYVHILGGINDAWLNMGLDAAQSAIADMVAIGLDHGIIPIIGKTTPICANPSGGDTFIFDGLDEIEIWLARFRKWLASFCTEHDLLLIDYYTALCFPGTGRGNPVYFHDECHLNALGNQVMAEKALQSLEHVLTVK